MAFPPLIRSKLFVVNLGFDIRCWLFGQLTGIGRYVPISGKRKADKTRRDY